MGSQSEESLVEEEQEQLVSDRRGEINTELIRVQFIQFQFVTPWPRLYNSCMSQI